MVDEYDNNLPIHFTNAACNLLKFDLMCTVFFSVRKVEVIPWIIADSNYVIPTSQKLDPTKTVFVGALHGKLTADGLAKIMNDLFDGVVYAGNGIRTLAGPSSCLRINQILLFFIAT